MISHDRDGPLPNIQYFRKWGVLENSPPMLKCEFGWNAEATRQFLSQEFQILSLCVLQDQKMEIPSLGEKAKCVTQLILLGAGTAVGIDQFQSVEMLLISVFPDDGIDFSTFPHLQDVSMPWNRTLSKRIFDCRNLHGIYVTEGFPETDCESFDKLLELRRVSFSAGKIRNLNGLERLPNLESISLDCARNFSSIGDLKNYSKLRSLDLDSLPKLEWNWQETNLRNLSNIALANLPTLNGTIDFSGCKSMEEIRIVNCKNLVAELSGIGEFSELKKLFLNVPHKGLNIDELFSRPKLRLFALMMIDELSELDDDSLHALASRYARKITSIGRTGPRKSRQLQVYFE